VFAETGENARRGEAVDSIVCHGSIISGGQVKSSIVGSDVRVNSYAEVEGSILFEGVDIGRHARVKNAIIDKGVSIPAHAEIGLNHDDDIARGFCISEGGIVVIAKADGVDHFSSSRTSKSM